MYDDECEYESNILQHCLYLTLIFSRESLGTNRLCVGNLMIPSAVSVSRSISICESVIVSVTLIRITSLLIMVLY